MRFSDISTRMKVIMGVGAPLVLLTALGITSLYTIKNLSDSNQAVERSHTILEDAYSIVGSAVDMETGMRGYLLAGKKEFLEPYNHGEKAVFESLEHLKKIMKDNPEQIKSLDIAKTTLSEWQQNVVKPNIRLREQIGDAKTMNDLAAEVKQARGQEYFDAFRNKFDEFGAREEKRLEARRKKFKASVGTISKNLESLVKNSSEITTINQSFTKLGEMKNIVGRMQSSIRGYLLAGNEDFLKAYQVEQKVFKSTNKGLQIVFKESKDDVAQLKQINAFIDQWNKDAVQPVIEIRQNVNVGLMSYAELESAVSKGIGTDLIKKFKNSTRAFEFKYKNRLTAIQKKKSKAESDIRVQLVLMNRNQKDVAATNQVLLEAEKMLRSALDMEVGMRGYLLTAKEDYLNPLNAEQNEFGKHFGKLTKMVRKDSSQVKSLGEMRQTIDQWRSDVVDPLTQLRREIGDAKTMDDMADLIGQAQGKKYFDKFRSNMVELKKVESAKMEKHVANSASTRTFALVAILGCILGGLLAGAAIAWFIGRSIANPIVLMTKAMSDLANGKNDTPIPGTGRGDEIGEMATAVKVFKDNAIKTSEMEAEQSRKAKKMGEQQVAMQEEAIAAERDLVGDVFGRALSALADKNLEYRLNEDIPEAYYGLRDDFNHAMDELATTIGEISEASARLRTGSNDIHKATEDLSRRTQQQAVSVEETAAALEESSTAIRTSAERANDAGSLVVTTKSNAERSGNIVKQAIDAMSRIESSAEEIAKIIALIDDIAFQTNLLALNAGVEAARAGDSGKGFAVVAQEVRQLAQRSAEAAREINQLINHSGDEVKAGVNLVNDTGKALETIVGEVTEINEHVAAIVSAVNEQSIGIQEINQSVNNIDQGTQKNAAACEDTTTASFSLSRELARIDEKIQGFKIGCNSTIANENDNDVENSQEQSGDEVAEARHEPRIITGTDGNAALAINEEEWENF